MIRAMIIAAAEEAGRPLSYFFYMREASDLAVGGKKKEGLNLFEPQGCEKCSTCQLKI